jgi:phosphohistidine phosphatase SixA
MRNVLWISIMLVCALEGFAQTPPPMNPGHIFVVRHAEKVSESADELSELGKGRAACLATTLKSANITTVITTQFNRTQQTATATADEFKVHLKPIKADDYATISQAARDAAKNGDVLVVGHSNTVPQIVKAISNVDVTVGGNEYDQLFVIDSTGVAQLHYCPSTAPEPESKMK